jgi:hypothetical protein
MDIIKQDNGVESREVKADNSRNLYTTMGTQLDPANDGVKAYPFVTTNTRVTSATTVFPLLGPGWIRIRVEGGTMGRVEVFNSLAASGSLKYDQTPAAKDIIFNEWVYCSIGATVKTTAATTLFIEAIAEV